MKLIVLVIFLISFKSFSIEKDSIEFLQWHIQKKELYISSKKYISRLKKKLNRNQIIGIELIIAEAADNQVQSKFGHALFRFVDNDNDPGNDITISFVADVNGPKLSNVDGIIGKYGVYPEVKSLRLFIKQYIKNQSRPLERHIIPSNKSMQKALIKTLDDWWTEIHQAREDIYSYSLNQARVKANKRGEELYGKEQFELFEIKFYDEEFRKEVTQSFGILEKSEQSFLNNEERDRALYRQAYLRANKKLGVEDGEIILNLYQELWKVNEDDKFLKIEEQSIPAATNKAQKYFSTDKIKLFQIFDEKFKRSGFYAISKDSLPSIDIIKKEKIELSVKNLEVVSVSSEVLGKYTFFSNNCAGAVIKFLKTSGFPHKRTVGIQGRIPVKLNKWMSRSLLVPYPSLKINGAQLLEKKIARILGFNEKEYQRYNFPIHQWKIISKYISDIDKFLFYDLFKNRLPTDYVNLIREEIEPLKAPDYNEVYRLEVANPIFYKLCNSIECAKEVQSELNTKWTSKEIKRVKKQVHRTANNTFISESLTKISEILIHLKLLKYLPLDFE